MIYFDSLGQTCFMLGSGDFFGEIALLASRPRMADVIAQSYCELLALNRKDFKNLLLKNPDLCAKIDKVAQERLDIDGS